MHRSYFALALVLALLACEEGESGITAPCGFGQPCPTDPIASVELALPAGPLVPGDSAPLTATALDSLGRTVDTPVTLHSSDSSVARIAPPGIVIAVAPGAATITAQAGTRQASGSLDVLPLIATSVAAGEDFSCLTTNVPGRSQCWGLGDAGQLGYATDTVCFRDDSLPTPLGCAIAPRVISRDLALTTVSAGDSLACGLAPGGTAWCWGANVFGQLGTGGVVTGIGPQRVRAPDGTFTAIAAGGRHACGIAGQATFCWGEDSLGQLGDDRTINSTTPIPVATSETFSVVSAGYRHSCAITQSGAAFCWGSNESGQLGIGTTGGHREVPIPVAGGHRFSAISAGDSSTCGVRIDGSVLCWGANHLGQLGRGSPGGVGNAPMSILSGAQFVAVTAGYGFACALEAGGQAYCWGSNDYGQLGSVGGTVSVPRLVDGGMTFASIAAGARHTCGRTSAGEVHCWGSNVFGALGNRLQAAVRGQPVRITLGR